MTGCPLGPALIGAGLRGHPVRERLSHRERLLLHLGPGGGELAKALELAVRPRESATMANGDGAPEDLGDQDRPHVPGSIVTGREQQLIARYAAHRLRMPASQRGA